MRHSDKIVKCVTTRGGAVLETQTYYNVVELALFDMDSRVAVVYLTTGEVQHLIDMLEEYL
ncbi:MAG: hypothetical protein ACREI9_14840 [Nitrospiraceae bacterium]